MRTALVGGIGVWLALALSGCTGQAEEEVPGRAPTRVSRAEQQAVVVEREVQAARAAIATRADSARDAFREVRGLTRDERADLRRDGNAKQVAVAQSLGVRAKGDEQVARLASSGTLVQLEDSTEHWVLRDLTHSVPFVTPDTKAMLEEIGRRFHERLDSLGLPRYRMEVTSVLRTPESQADLRSSNANAAKSVSAHEFGTTLDVAHIRFSAPAPTALAAEVPSAPERTAELRAEEAAVLDEIAEENAAALQAELGRVLREMREERKLRVMMERSQAVYHMTVARRLAR